jgi:hypothetical protein
VAPNADAKRVAAADAGLVKMVVRSRPTRAFLSVDGEPMGRTPVTLNLEPGTEVALVAKARGYLPKSEQIKVDRSVSDITLALPVLPYDVEVVSDPPGARATTSGGGEITTPGQLRFRSMLTPRTITVSKDGYTSVSKTVNRSDFREESRRRVTSIEVKLRPATAAPSTASATTTTPATPGSAPPETIDTADTVAAPESDGSSDGAALEAPSLRETTDDDAP